MSSTKTFTIIDNINSAVIIEFVDFFKNGTKEGLDTVHIDIVGKRASPSELIGEIDPVFLSYIILFLDSFEIFKVEFTINELELSGRAFSLRDQLKQFLYLNPRLKNRFFLKGKIVDKETGEIKNVHYNLGEAITQSEKFIPLLFISNKAEIQNFFINKYSHEQGNDLWKLYFKNLVEKIKTKTKYIEDNLSPYPLDELNSLTFIETCILNLLLSDEIFENRNVSEDKKKKIIERDRIKISNYIELTLDICRGLKELALNVIEHSTSRKGIISCRLFDKNRLATLKGDSENKYIDYINDDFFLDTNIIDFGIKSIRQTYLSNLGNSPNNAASDESLKKDRITIETEYNYEDFFIVNFEKFKKLDHQQNKIISRYGLHYFTHIIKDYYSGFIKSSSINEGFFTYRNEGADETKPLSENHIQYGTFYNCIIPINKSNKHTNLTRYNLSSTKKETTKVNSFKELDNFEIIEANNIVAKPSSKSRKLYHYRARPSATNSRKYDAIVSAYTDLINLPTYVKSETLLINAADFLNENESQWIRLLSAISMVYSDIIIYNLPSGVVKNLIEIRRSVDSSEPLNFWNDDNRVLFYSFKENSSNPKIKRFGATLLTGSNQLTFDILNKNIWRHHYSFRKGFINPVNEDDNQSTEYVYKNSKLFHNRKLFYFELLIHNQDEYKGKLSLFEQSVQFSLNKEFNSEDNYETNNRGYKISETHFRLGSKIHIKDFYYAKRLFQNSFFTTPLSYIVSKSLIEIVSNPNIKLIREENNKANEPDIEITIIGYEDYSSFLTSTLRNVLEKHRVINGLNIRFNHNTIKDGKLSKGLDTIQRNIVILVPIASSFSTSIKIKNQLEEIFATNHHFKFQNNYNILSKSLNLILVGHKANDNTTFEKIASNNIDDTIHLGSPSKFYKYDDDLLNKTYNWVSIDRENKIVKLEAFNNANANDFTYQKYFIPVYTKWNDADDCNLCNPENITDEKCLIETGKTSITPTLIFGFPKTKMENAYGDNPVNLKNSILYGNIVKGNNHYLYFSKSGQIVSNNKEKIIAWLLKLKEEVFNEESLKYQKVVLVTPATGTKSNFVDLVNEHLFEYTANCLTISLGEDYIENTESLYSDGLYQADIVIFVDDVLSTINSFLETNYITKYIRNKVNTGKGIDYCISLINRMSYDCEDNLLIKLPNQKNDKQTRLLYFSKINNPTIEEPNNEFPLTKEGVRYNYLAETSSLDSIKELFLTKINKLEPVDIEKNVPDRIKDNVTYFDKKLFQLIVLNQFYKLFEISHVEIKKNGSSVYHYKHKLSDYINPSSTAFDKLQDFILAEIQKDNSHKEIIDKYTHNIKYVLLKIICSTPLIYYKDIRSSAFQWILNELEVLRNEIASINRVTLKPFFEVSYINYFSKFQRLKFLLKRSVQLKSNYIFHPVFLESLESFINMIYEGELELNREFQSSNGEIFSSLKELFETTKYSPGKLLVVKYLMELKHILQPDENENSEYANFMKSFNLKELESVDYQSSGLFDELKDNFEIKFTAIKGSSKFAPISSKKFIHQLISLVKELIDEHETKAIRLEKNIANNKNSYRYNPLDNLNGNFNHFLRLLKLENTAIIERFWEYYKIKESGNFSKMISTENVEDIATNYCNDPKFKVIKDNLVINCENSFKYFILLQSKLFNWGIKEKAYKSNENDLKSKVNQILVCIKQILGDEVNSIYFTVNYGNLTEPQASQLYSFDPYTKTNTISSIRNFENQESFKSSLTIRMFNPHIGNNVDGALSNIEVYKSGGKLQYREGIFQEDEINQYSEVKALNAKEEFSILAIRISDLLENRKLFTQAVITIVSEKGNRINESKLRLLLLIRKSLSEFLKRETSSNTFFELLENRTVLNYQRHLKHGIGNFTFYQKQIVQQYENIESKVDIDEETADVRLELDRQYIKHGSFDFKEFNVITNSIKSQIGVSTKKNSSQEIFFYDKFIDVINTIYKSEKIGEKIGSLDFLTEVTLLNKIPFDSISLPTTLIDSIIPEILLNQKKYGINRTINWEDNKLFLKLVFSNNIKPNSYDESDGYGLKMCIEIRELYENNIIVTLPEKPYNNEFTVSIEISKGLKQ
jgi:hypothetical protein